MNKNIAILCQPLKLACGVELPNRLAKSAMSEQLGSLENSPTEGLIRLYKRWASGGAGLIVTGNVMIDRTALIEPRNVVIENEHDLPMLSEWANAGKANGAQIWMQINHPGRQSPRFLSPKPVAPSSVPLQVVKNAFAKPRALTESEIEHLIERYAYTAAGAKKAGFTGVQIHAAHGYLISQFLSPITNQRTDAWGGTPQKRMRFVLEIFHAMRDSVGRDFPIGIKLNSADFQRGGFSEEESMDVVRALERKGIDLIEISGGTYEKLMMVGAQSVPQKESTRQREAYFLEYVRKVRETIRTPIMLTGGFRSAAAMAAAIEEGSVDIIGLARPLAVEPDLPVRLLTDRASRSIVRPLRTGVKAIDQLGLIELVWYTQQLQRMGARKAPAKNRSPWTALAIALITTCRDIICRKRV